MENAKRPQRPVLSVKSVQLNQKNEGLDMMTIEDNSDLRAAMNFAHNALKRVMHVFIITQDAPRQLLSNITDEDDGTKLGHVNQDDSFSLALKEINRN